LTAVWGVFELGQVGVHWKRTAIIGRVGLDSSECKELLIFSLPFYENIGIIPVEI
jgi:hypothetical protein